MKIETPSNDILNSVTTLRQDGGLVDLGAVDRVRLTGEDRLRFLGGLVTAETKSLAPGHGTYAFFTTIKGRLLADAVVLASEDDVTLELPAGHGTEIAEHLTKYRIADRVEIESVDDARWMCLVGPALLEAPALSTEHWAHGPVSLAGVEAVRAFRDPRLGLPALSLVVDAATAAAMRDHEGIDEAATETARQAIEIIRIEAGRPRFGVDIGPQNFPQETGVQEEAVSYTKGCYLGQEIVARIHYRGGVNRRLAGLRFSSVDATAIDASTILGAELSLDGRAVGTVNSFAHSPAHGPIGLAVIHNRAEDNQMVEIASENAPDAVRASITPLPFAS